MTSCSRDQQPVACCSCNENDKPSKTRGTPIPTCTCSGAANPGQPCACGSTLAKPECQEPHGYPQTDPECPCPDGRFLMPPMPKRGPYPMPLPPVPPPVEYYHQLPPAEHHRRPTSPTRKPLIRTQFEIGNWSSVCSCCAGCDICGLNEIMDVRIWRMLLAEFVGTLLLVLIGCGAIVTFPADLPLSSAWIVQVALTFGLTIGTIVQCICHCSGGHVNPAVTLSFFVTGDIKLLKSLLYIIVQCLGAIAGSGILLQLMPPETPKLDRLGNLGATTVNPEISSVQGMCYELILTFLLCFVVHGVCDPRRRDVKGSAPLAIGLAIVACHLSGIRWTGSSINPARSIGPAVIMNEWTNHWVYWAGPILGGILAGLFYRFVLKVRKGEDDSYDL